jgi:tetratricopeptide (TPR) repeat protein
MLVGGRARALLAGALLLLCSGCTDEATRLAEHLERGNAYLQEQKYAEAVIEFKNVLQLDPNHAAAHYGLAKSYLGQKDLQRAYWELQESSRLDPTNVDARLQYAEFLLLGKEEDLEEAIQLAGEVLELAPERVEPFLLRARALQSLGKPEEARADFQKAVEVMPESGVALLMLANFERRQGEREVAEPLFRKLTEVEPGFAAWSALGGFLAADRSRDEEAEATYRKALELAKDEQRSIAVQTLASFYYSRGRFEESERTLREGIEAAGGDLDLIYTLARFHHARGQTDRADQVIEEATRAHPDDPKPQLVLSAYRGQKGDAEGALAAAEAALQIDPEHRAARLRKAELLVELGYRNQDSARIAEGRGIVDAILAREAANPDALFVRAKLEMAEGRYPDAVATMRRALDARPEWAHGHFMLGSALFAAGDRAGARPELTRALEIDASLVEARRVLSQVHAALGDHELAVEEGERVLGQRPGDAKLRIVVAQSLVRQSRFEPGLEMLLAIPETERDAEAHYAIGRIHQIQGDRAAARVALERAAELAPGNSEVLGALLRLDAEDGRLGDSLARIDAALAAAPQDARLLRTRGIALLASGRSAEAEESLRRAIEADPNDLASYGDLAQMLARSGRSDEALRTYEQALAAQPESAALNLIVGILHEGSGQAERAIEYYEKAIRSDPGLGVAKNNLAYLLAERGQELDRALDLAQEAKSLLPESPNTADTLGWVLYKKSIPSAAIGYLKEAEGGMRSEDPALGIVRQHLALAYEANGDAEKAREVVEHALEDLGKIGHDASPSADELRRLRDRLATTAAAPAEG